ncbi:MAG: hypothetical protein A3F74_16885 [Betaproteobacteria bacterium RIFCSPLOWO2_12_FULL_62_58]|nr:MAG: hypothetical protein A3F74_16885 [Betaproteobacteria bacterium RIFCSPLOWO2_12_FULL_62_58]
MDLRKIERVYSSYARVYDRLFGRIFQHSREAAVRDLNVEPGERVLEVGVGTGLCLPSYPRHCKITAIDLSNAMLVKARDRVRVQNLAHVTLMRMDAGDMKFPDGSFDIVVAAYVITAVPDYRKVMSEMIRVCRPGGRDKAKGRDFHADAVIGQSRNLERGLRSYPGTARCLDRREWMMVRTIALGHFA